MNNKKVVIVGGGLGGLKLVKLLACLDKKGLEITLISDFRYFVFLPLVPDYLSGNLKELDRFTTDIADFCRVLDVLFVGDRCIRIDEQKKEVELATGQSQKYDICVLCTGLEGCGNHKRIWRLIDSLYMESLEYVTDRMGLAEFEIMSALEEARKSVKINNVGRYKDLNNHWLRGVLSRNNRLKRFNEVNGFIKSRTVEMEEKRTRKEREQTGGLKSVLVIGAAMKDCDGVSPSAQRSSQNAHVAAYCINRHQRKGASLIDEAEKRFRNYKPRGEMIFVTANDALVWLGARDNRRATLSGYAASLVRHFFYRLEFWFYYKTKGAPRVLCRLINWARMHAWA